MKAIILADGFNGHKVVCHPLPLEKDATAVKLRVYGSGLIKWASLKDYEEACKIGMEMPDLPKIEVINLSTPDGSIPAARLVAGGVNGVIEEMHIHPGAIDGLDFLKAFIEYWESFAHEKGWEFSIHDEIQNLIMTVLKHGNVQAAAEEKTTLSRQLSKCPPFPESAKLNSRNARSKPPNVWIGSHYGEDDSEPGHPAAYLILPPLNGKAVELVLETVDVDFSSIEDSEVAHDMISRWQAYAGQHGYGFEYDMELYEFLDDRGCWSCV